MTELMTWMMWVTNPMLILLAPLLLAGVGGFIAGRWVYTVRRCRRRRK